MTASAAIGFLHTSATHVATFDRLVEASGAGPAVHAVDEALLADVRAHGPTVDVRGRLAAHLDDLRAAGAVTIVCTCSTLAGLAEGMPVLGAEVVRVDRAMAEDAVRLGSRIAVVVALASTSGPTQELLVSCAQAADAAVELVEVRCEDAWRRFEAGDLPGYVAAVRSAVEGVVHEVDVVVLAQASMAPAAEGSWPVPVLSSPAPAVARAVDVLRTAEDAESPHRP